VGNSTVAPSLFDEAPPLKEALQEGAFLLRGFVTEKAAELVAEIHQLLKVSPLRHMQVRGGRSMSVAMSNCGKLGWLSDQNGYRYDEIDPLTGRPWPAMPAIFLQASVAAAAEAGFADFAPDACLINRYEPGAQMGLHQDKDETNLSAPIVSVSLGLRATFLFGGTRRNDPRRRVPLESGDVVVWGAAARLVYHGIAKLQPGEHPLTGSCRYNLTFRRAR